MVDPHDAVSVKEFFDKMTPDMLLHRLASRLCMEEEDARALEAKFEKLRDWLLPALGDTVSAIRLYGSLTRRTGLAAPFDPSPDVDCLLVLEPNLFLDRYVLSQPKKTRPELLWARDIVTRLRPSKEFDDKNFTSNAPYMSIQSGKDIFELTMSTGVPEAMEDPSAVYGIYGTMTAVERAARHAEEPEADDSSEDENNNSRETKDDEDYDLDRSPDFMGFERRPDEDINWNYGNTVESVEPISPDGKLYGLSIMTQPFFYNGLIEQYSAIYGDYWRYLILLWKYWLKSCRAPFRSYFIEDNVFRGLQYSGPFEAASNGGDIDLLHFVATYFRNRRLYDHKRFESDTSFSSFRNGLIHADNLFRAGSRADSLDVLSDIFARWEPNYHGK